MKFEKWEQQCNIWPLDELSLFATLRGPLFAIDDSTLLRFRHEVGRLHPFGETPGIAPMFVRPCPAGMLRRRGHIVAATPQPLAEPSAGSTTC